MEEIGAPGTQIMDLSRVCSSVISAPWARPVCDVAGQLLTAAAAAMQLMIAAARRRCDILDRPKMQVSLPPCTCAARRKCPAQTTQRGCTYVRATTRSSKPPSNPTSWPSRCGPWWCLTARLFPCSGGAPAMKGACLAGNIVVCIFETASRCAVTMWKPDTVPLPSVAGWLRRSAIRCRSTLAGCCRRRPTLCAAPRHRQPPASAATPLQSSCSPGQAVVSRPAARSF